MKNLIIFITLIFCAFNLRAHDGAAESKCQQQIEQLRAIVCRSNVQEFGECLADMTEEIPYSELIKLIVFIQDFAGKNSNNYKDFQDMIDYLIIAAAGYAYDRQPFLRNALQEHIVYNALMVMSSENLK